MGAIILFDGVCNLCDRSVQFIIKRDPNGYFQFASLQGQTGQRLLAEYGLPAEMNSVVLIEKEKVYVKSNAALKVFSHLNGFWRLLVVFRPIPTFLRDLLYNWVARNRYKWFGKKDRCLIPSPNWKHRFLE